MSSEMPVSAIWMNGRFRGPENPSGYPMRIQAMWAERTPLSKRCSRLSSARADVCILQRLGRVTHSLRRDRGSKESLLGAHIRRLQQSWV